MSGPECDPVRTFGTVGTVPDRMPQWGQPPSGEDLHALSLLVEQFGVTLHNSRLQATQLAAEQRMLQQEKLSTLGLIAGSLAHEIKNPLSTIKTITRVLSEDLDRPVRMRKTCG